MFFYRVCLFIWYPLKIFIFFAVWHSASACFMILLLQHLLLLLLLLLAPNQDLVGDRVLGGGGFCIINTELNEGLARPGKTGRSASLDTCYSYCASYFCHPHSAFPMWWPFFSTYPLKLFPQFLAHPAPNWHTLWKNPYAFSLNCENCSTHNNEWMPNNLNFSYNFIAFVLLVFYIITATTWLVFIE